jgi:hypothetical protein
MATNVMSYNDTTSTCVADFTRMQVAVMLHWLEKKCPDKAIWKDAKYVVDTFEPDNRQESASAIVLGETQARNFNYQPAFIGMPNTSCDVDVIRYRSLTAGNISFTTSATGLTNAHTSLTLHESVDGGRSIGNVVARSTQTGTNNFSQLSYNCRAGFTYFIRVENRQPSIGGFYNITVGCNLTNLSIAGPESFCNQASYSVTGLPANATVTWSQSGSLSGTTSGNTYNVSGTHNEFVTLTATVNAPCSPPVTFTRRVAANNPSPPPGENMINGDTPSGPGGYSYFIPMYMDIYHYEWFVSGPNGVPYHSQDGTNYCYVNMDTPGWYTLNVKGTNDCGEIWFDSQQLEVYVPYDSPYYSYYSYSPNPASDELTISYDNGLKDKSDDNLKKPKVKKDFEVKLIDSRGKIWGAARNTSIENKVKLNTTDIPDGTYYLHILDGKESIRKQIIIKH